jgi:hypothetical protein
MAMKPTPADIAKHKKMMEQRLKMKDPALTKKPSISSLIEKPKAKAKAKAKPLTGDKAAEALKKRTSPKGVKEFEKRASKALDKKYPGLYKKSK